MRRRAHWRTGGSRGLRCCASTGYRPEKARALGGFLGGIHAMDAMLALVPHDTQPLAEWLADARSDRSVFAPQLTLTARGAVEIQRAMRRTPPPTEAGTSSLAISQLPATTSQRTSMRVPCLAATTST